MRALVRAVLPCLAAGLVSMGASAPTTAATVRVGVIPVIDLAPFYAAVDQGYFKQEGIELEITTAGGGPAVMTPLAAGQLDIGFSNIVTVLQGIENGIDFRVVAPGTAMSAGNDVNPCVVVKDGPVKTPKDLEGRKVAVNALNNIVWLYARALFEKKGADLSKIRFVEVPFPQMLDALLSGQIDAACPTEPFFTRAMESGKIAVLGFPYHENTDSLQSVMAITKAEWARANQDTLQRFVRAYLKGVAYIEQHKIDPIGVKIISGYTKMDPAIVAKIQLPKFPMTVRPAGIEETAQLMVKYGLLKKMIDVNAIIDPVAVKAP